MWSDKKKAHKPDAVSYAAIFKENNLVERIRSEELNEIWIWGAPYFGTDEYAMKPPRQPRLLACYKSGKSLSNNCFATGREGCASTNCSKSFRLREGFAFASAVAAVMTRA
jgi:hypothetical protein